MLPYLSSCSCLRSNVFCIVPILPPSATQKNAKTLDARLSSALGLR